MYRLIDLTEFLEFDPKGLVVGVPREATLGKCQFLTIFEQ